MGMGDDGGRVASGDATGLAAAEGVDATGNEARGDGAVRGVGVMVATGGGVAVTVAFGDAVGDALGVDIGDGVAVARGVTVAVAVAVAETVDVAVACAAGAETGDAVGLVAAGEAADAAATAAGFWNFRGGACGGGVASARIFTRTFSAACRSGICSHPRST